MIKLSMLFKKSVQLTLVSVLALAALPVANVNAAGLTGPTNPPAEATRVSDQRLERVWTRLQRIHERQGRTLDRADVFVDRIQALIDRMEENGKDVTALQAALDAFEDALKDAHPIYESAKGIINAHQGFDADGKLTDHEKAVDTVRALGQKNKEIRKLVGEPRKAFREAIQAFRDARPPADTSGAN